MRFIFGKIGAGCALWLCIFCTQTVARQPINLSDITTSYSIAPTMLLFEDTTGTMELSAIRHAETSGQFKPSLARTPNLGFTRSAFWISFDIIETTPSTQQWIVDIALPSLHSVCFYLLSDDRVVKTAKAGFLVDKHSRLNPFRNPSFEINAPGDKARRVFIRTTSQTPIILPIYIREKQHYLEYDRIREFLLGLYFGALFIMAFYNLYLFVSLSDRSYFWLVLFIATFAMGQLSAVYGFLADWGISPIQPWLKWLHVINFVAAFAGIQLSRALINARKYAPRTDIVLQTIGWASLGLALLSPLMSFMIAEQILSPLNIIPLPFLVFAAIVSFRKGHIPALYYLVATSCLTICLIIYNLMYSYSVFPFGTAIYFLPNIAFVIMLILSSAGLSHQYSTMRKEREEARESAIASLSQALRANEERLAMEKELSHSRKMDAIGRLLSGIAHDTANFVSPMIGYVQLIKKEARASEKISQYTTGLNGALDRLKALTDSLVNISKKKSMQHAGVDLNKAVLQISSLLKHSAPTNISFQAQIANTDTMAWGDEGEIYAAIMNVGVNALEAMPSGGTATITSGIHDIEAGNRALMLFGVEPGKYAFVKIADSGEGMDPAILEHIFEPFFTTKTKGTGLGLAGVYRCVKDHQGFVEISSQRGEGTLVALYFPHAPAN